MNTVRDLGTTWTAKWRTRRVWEQESVIDKKAWDEHEKWDQTTQAMEWVTLGQAIPLRMGIVVARRAKPGKTGVKDGRTEGSLYRVLDTNGVAHEVDETALVDPGMLMDDNEEEASPAMEKLAKLAKM